MQKFLTALFFSLFSAQVSDGFLGSVGRVKRTCPLVLMSQLPTLEQLSYDPFMRQVQHGADLTNALKDTANDLSDEDLRPLIQAQLSHSDGIRGLMVAFLTAEDDDSDAFRIPNVMVQALQEQAQSSPVELIPLASMKTMHQDDELRQSSSRTARRAFCVLQALAGKHPSVENNAKAVLVVASNKTVDE